MSSFKPIDPKRDEIRRYLERGNVMESLTKVFIRVIKERPENPMEYIQKNIGVVRHQHDKYERLQKDLQNANSEIERLRKIIKRINPEALESKTKQQTREEPQETENKPHAVNAAETESEAVVETDVDQTKQQTASSTTTESAQPSEAYSQALAPSDDTATNTESPVPGVAVAAGPIENSHVIEKQTPSAQKEQNDNNTD